LSEFEEDSTKMQKIHSLIEKSFPNKEVFIESYNSEVKWEVRDKLQPKELKQTKKEKI